MVESKLIMVNYENNEEGYLELGLVKPIKMEYFTEKFIRFVNLHTPYITTLNKITDSSKREVNPAVFGDISLKQRDYNLNPFSSFLKDVKNSLIPEK